MIKICNYCKKEFETKDKRQKYCNIKCSSNSRKVKKVKANCKRCNKVTLRYPSQVSNNSFCSRECMKLYNQEKHSLKIKCEICGKEIVRIKSHYERTNHNYCSYECAHKGHSKNYSGENHSGFLNTYVNCSYCDKIIYRKKSEIERRENFFCSAECQSNWQSENIVGENHPNYNKNLSEEERLNGRMIDGYWQFRKSVYERDNYTCMICGYDKGGTLNAHHLNSFHWDKENRLNPKNAITLCETCHKKFHSIYGNKSNTKEQFKEFENQHKETL